LWTTTYLANVLDALRSEGFPITDEAAAHLTPRSTTTSTSTAPTPSTSTPNSAAKDTDRYVNRPDLRQPGCENNQIRSVA
jgi:hypothetical protein